MNLSKLGGILLLLIFASAAFAQKGGILRGNIFDSSTGEPIIYGTVVLEGTDFGMNTNLEGFFSFIDVPAGDYKLIVTYVGFETYEEELKVENNKILYRNIEIEPSSVQLNTFKR